MSLSGIDARWRQLDPVFVRGMQRSGTSVMVTALVEVGMAGFAEGHLWFELVKPFSNLRDPNYYPDYRRDSYTLGQGRLARLEKYIAVALDQFHRDHLPSDAVRWICKSPGFEAVLVVPLLASLFPRAQFIFMYRNGITNVHSGTKFWEGYPDIFQIMCQGWAKTMSAWREARRSLDGRYIEIAQEEMATNPLETAARLADFLNLEAPELQSRLADVFQQRILSAFPDKHPGDYQYQIDWSTEQKDYFIKICGEEMEIWGYRAELDSLKASMVREMSTLTPAASSEENQPVLDTSADWDRLICENEENKHRIDMLRDQLHHCQVVVESMGQSIQEKDALIQEKDALIQEKDTLIQDKDALIRGLMNGRVMRLMMGIQSRLRELTQSKLGF